LYGEDETITQATNNKAFTNCRPMYSQMAYSIRGSKYSSHGYRMLLYAVVQ